MLYAFGFALIGMACNSQQEAVNKAYIGEWGNYKGQFSFKIYEENEALFIKFRKGEILPLTYQEEGKYFNAPSVFGSLPLVIHDDTLRYSQSKYTKIKE